MGARPGTHEMMFKRSTNGRPPVQSANAPYALAAVAFAESSFFPLPPDVILAPMSLAKPQLAWRYALIATIASVLGGVVGYGIGALLFDTLGQWLIHLYGYADRMAALKETYARWGALVILVKGFTPIPLSWSPSSAGCSATISRLFIGAVAGDARRAVLPARGRAQSFRRSAAPRAGTSFCRFSRVFRRRDRGGFVIAARVF